MGGDWTAFSTTIFSAHTFQYLLVRGVPRCLAGASLCVNVKAVRLLVLLSRAESRYQQAADQQAVDNCGARRGQLSGSLLTTRIEDSTLRSGEIRVPLSLLDVVVVDVAVASDRRQSDNS